jgi:uncharacterized protein (DUF1330 family)
MAKAYWIARVDVSNEDGFLPNIKVRQPHSVADIVIIEGYDGPQP